MAGMSTFGPTEAQKLREVKMLKLKEAVRTKQAAVDDLKAKMHRYYFNYSPPEPNFDSNRVMGTLASLIKHYDPKFSIALETVAGDKLYSVVVDSTETSMLLMMGGNLSRNTSFIALNSCGSGYIHRELVDAAQELVGGPGHVQLAVDLITYDSKYKPVMQLVFGKTLICTTLQIAVKLAYHPGLCYSVITQDGDIVHPDGLLTGGVPPEGRALAQRATLETLLLELKHAEAALADFMKNPYSGIAAVKKAL